MHNLPSRHVSYFVWFLVFGSVLALLFMGARLPQDVRSLSTVDRDKTGWTLSQVEAGFYQLSATVLYESKQASIDSDLIRLRTEIALSRLDLLKTKSNRELFSTYDDATDWYQTIELFKDQSINVIDRQGPLSLDDVEELEALIRSVLPGIRSLSVAGFVIATEQEAKRRVDVTQKIMRFGSLTIALLVGLAILLLYLARLLNRARKKDVQLRTLTTRLSAILEASLDGVVVADSSGKIIDFNATATRVFGWAQNDILGKLVNDTISPSLGECENWNSGIQHLRFPKVRTFGGHKFESVALRKCGAEFPVEVTVTTLNDASGKVYLIAFKDISDQKVLENKTVDARKEAERANHAKTQFLRAMSHEMRTPLSVILGTLDLLNIEKLGEKQVAFVNSAAASGDMLLSLINDALDITRVETGDISLNPEAFSLLDITNNVVDMIQPLAYQKGLSISMQFDPEIDHLYSADKLRLSQILTNLLGNAVKYTDSGSIKVVVSGVKKATGVLTRIQIVDTGLGIPEDQHEGIFEYFVTSSAMPIERHLRSDGLGLPLSRKIARLLGGDISLEDNVGEGSTFTLELFLDYVHGTVPTVLEDRHENRPRLSILVVEDTVQTYKVLEDFFVHLNHHMVGARDGVEGVEKALKNHFDLIIMDLNMPLLDGYEATRRIRRECGPNRETFILGLTGHSPEDVREDIRKAGMNAVYAKPIRLSKLQEILRNPEIAREHRYVS